MKINPDWQLIYDQLLFFEKGGDFNHLNDLTVDSLRGSMFGLNYRYITLQEVLKRDKQKLVRYALQRIQPMLKENNFKFKKRPVPRCGVGLGTFGWKYDEKLILEAAKLNVALIDTAEGYGFGRVEFALGNVLESMDFTPTIYTKVRRDHMSPNAIVNAVKRSIQKLKVKPFEQIHFPHDKYNESAIKTLADLQTQSTIRGVGLGNCSVDMIENTQRILTEYNGTPINSVQISFSLLNLEYSTTVIPYCQERGILVMAYSPLGQNFKNLKTPFLKKMAKKYSATESQIALSWVLSHRGVLPIPATNNVEHLKQNMESQDLVLDIDDVEVISRYYSNLKKIV